MTAPGQPFHQFAVEVENLTTAANAANALIKQAGVPYGLDGPWFSPDGSSIGIDTSLTYFLTRTANGFVVQKQERNDADTIAEFNRFDEAYKYMLWIIWDAARSSNQLEKIRRRWFNDGPDVEVSIKKEGHHNRLVLLSELESECVIYGRGDAIAFTHVMVRTPEQLEAVLRDGLPELTD